MLPVLPTLKVPSIKQNNFIKTWNIKPDTNTTHPNSISKVYAFISHLIASAHIFQNTPVSSFKTLEYRFFVGSTKIENASFPYKTAISEPNLRRIEWRVQNGPIIKNRVLPVTALFFWRFCFSLRTFYKELIWCTNDPNAHIYTFCKRWSFIWRCFSLWVYLSCCFYKVLTFHQRWL